MPPLAVVGGTGLDTLEGLTVKRHETVETPYGPPSGPLVRGVFHGKPIVFLARHGERHAIAPHRINYRANLWALRESGARRVLAACAVGGIHPGLTPGRLAVPDQIIDYTWGREHTLFDTDVGGVEHVDFTEPYCEALRALLLRAGAGIGIDLADGGTYGATQGPRLESPAEIDRMERDGCQMVGMTGMPEASLARELGLCYAACAVVANPAAGRGAGGIRMADILSALAAGMRDFHRLLVEVLWSSKA